MRTLTVNAGSSSVKLRLVDDQDRVLVARELRSPAGQLDQDELERAVEGELSEADAVAHPIVHAGERFRAPVAVDDAVVRELRALTDLGSAAPAKVAGAYAVSGLLPRLPAIACFDTAFHATLPAAASTYALPASWRERWTLRKFASTGCLTAGLAAGHRSCSRRARTISGSSPAISVPARHRARSGMGDRSTRRWGSPRSTVR